MRYITKRFRVFPVFILIGLLLTSSQSLAGDQVIWYHADFPPYVISNGPYKGLGIEEKIYRYIEQRLPEYTFTHRHANYDRAQVELKKGQHVLVSPLLKTKKRESFIHYSSHPNFLLLPNALLVNRSGKDRFIPFLNSEGSLDIDALCASGDFKIGIAAGRVYKGILDTLIHKYKTSGVFHERKGMKQSGLLAMLHKGRIDAAFGYPVEIKYAGYADSMISLRVSGAPTCLASYLGAPKNRWGRDLMKKINTIIADQSSLKTYIKYYEYWLDEGDRRHYQKIKNGHCN